MVKNPLLEKMKQNRPALGINSQNPHEAELLANLGFDYFRIDHMWTDTDWGQTQTLLWACEAAGITPVLRLESNPWIGDEDPRLLVDLSRAQGIGAQFVTVNYTHPRQIEKAVLVAKDWHRRPMTVHPFKGAKWESKSAQIAEQTFVIPLAETKEMLERAEEVIALPDVKMFYISGTDGSRMVTGQQSSGWESPVFWDWVKRIVEMCEKHGVYVGMNPSYAYTLKEMRERVKRLMDAGIKMIMLQTTPFFLQVAMTEFLDDLRATVDW